MIDFIADKDEFIILKDRFLKIFRSDFDVINNPYNSNFKYFLAFDFDFMYTVQFFDGMKYFLSKLDLKKLFFYTIKPSPEEYFFKHFSKYNAFEINSNCTDEDLNSIMMRDPGNSPADALAINSNEVAWFSENESWAILGSRNLEIAVVGFITSEIQELFLSSFDNKSEVFNTIEKQVELLNELVHFKDQNIMRYKVFIENYKSKSK